MTSLLSRMRLLYTSGNNIFLLMIFCTCRLTYPSTRTIKFSTFLYLLVNLYDSGHGLKRILPSSVRSITFTYSFRFVCLFFICNCDCDIFTSLGSVTSLLFRGLSVILALFLVLPSASL